MSMSEEVGPAVRRRQLSRQLREARTAAGFTTMEAAASATGFSRATISRIESAKQVILPRTVRFLCQVYGIGSPTLDHMLKLAGEAAEDRGWQVDFADVVPDWFDRYVGEEADATEMWTTMPNSSRSAADRRLLPRRARRRRAGGERGRPSRSSRSARSARPA